MWILKSPRCFYESILNPYTWNFAKMLLWRIQYCCPMVVLSFFPHVTFYYNHLSYILTFQRNGGIIQSSLCLCISWTACQLQMELTLPLALLILSNMFQLSFPPRTVSGLCHFACKQSKCFDPCVIKWYLMHLFIIKLISHPTFFPPWNSHFPGGLLSTDPKINSLKAKRNVKVYGCENVHLIVL